MHTLLPIGKHPLILREQPQSLHGVFGTDIEFRVSASGPGSISFQWMKDENNIILKDDKLSSDIQNNFSILTVYSFTIEDVGEYKCVVKNEDFTLTSNIATLTGIIVI